MIAVSDKAVEEFKKILKEVDKENLSIKFINSSSSCCSSSIKILL